MNPHGRTGKGGYDRGRNNCHYHPLLGARERAAAGNVLPAAPTDRGCITEQTNKGNLHHMPTAAANAIARMEGYLTAAGAVNPNTRAAKNNNPGNIWDGLGNGKVKRIWPSMAIDDKGFVIFPSAAAGWAELERQLLMKANRGLTLQAALTEWAPPVENDTATYVRNVESWTGYAANTPLSNVLRGSAGGVILATTGGGGNPTLPHPAAVPGTPQPLPQATRVPCPTCQGAATVYKSPAVGMRRG